MSDAPELSPSRLRSHILDTLRVPADAPWYAAYSGGLDSTVLLHCLARVAADAGSRLVALHADHGLSPNAPDWRAHCERRCGEWGVECRSTRLTLQHGDKRGPEGRARDARYRWFRTATGGDGWLFTAHHRGDQAETVIERLTRGAGPRGLGGMSPVGRLYGLNVVRPLLGWPRESLQDYAAREGLDWITDESNTDLRLTRNYIRRRVLPAFRERWPDIDTALATTADAMADTQAILDQAAEVDLARVDDYPVRGDPSLSIPDLRALEPARQRNLLRHWLHRELGVTPGFRRLDHIRQAVEGHPDPAGGMTWPPIDLRPHGERLYLLRYHPEPDAALTWDLEDDLRIDDTLTLCPRPVTGRGLKRAATANGVTVAFRKGGEKCRLPGRPHHHSLKQVLQEAGIPPWQRPGIPLILVNNEIAAIAGVEYCDPYAAAADEPGIEIETIYNGSSANNSA